MSAKDRRSRAFVRCVTVPGGTRLSGQINAVCDMFIAAASMVALAPRRKTKANGWDFIEFGRCYAPGVGIPPGPGGIGLSIEIPRGLVAIAGRQPRFVRRKPLSLQREGWISRPTGRLQNRRWEAKSGPPRRQAAPFIRRVGRVARGVLRLGMRDRMLLYQVHDA